MAQHPLSPALPGLLAADIVTKSPGATKTYHVRLRYDAGTPPTGFIDALVAIGFTSPRLHEQESLHAGLIVVLDLAKPGTGLFNAWTPAEADAALAALSQVFAAHSVPYAPRRADSSELL